MKETLLPDVKLIAQQTIGVHVVLSAAQNLCPAGGEQLQPIQLTSHNLQTAYNGRPLSTRIIQHI